ncbi:MAG: hypothetical protein EOM67_15675 [Spirochaetia bacterium]|nr:hypothetical protein [Spirochaetia bacterium]
MEYEKVILDLLSRIVTLEGKVAYLESLGITHKDEPNYNDKSPNTSNQRDKTKYVFEGKHYGKRALVLAIVKSFLKKNPGIKIADLESAFDKSLQGSLGVVRELEEVKRSVSDYQRRFFTKSSEVLYLRDGKVVVCSQWGIGNIGNFLQRASDLGFVIRSMA